jgi:hypothetical protein
VGCGTGRTCALYTAGGGGGMAGCCAADDTQDCGWAYDCVPYASWFMNEYDTAYDSNSFVRMCTDTASPYCVTWAYPSVDGAAYACVESDVGVVTVEQSAEDAESVYFITLPTYSGLAVTGWDVELSSVESDEPSILLSTSVAPTSSDLETTSPALSTVPSSRSSSTSSSSSSTTTTPVPQLAHKKTPVAVIAGAVIGGLAVLFLLGAALLLLCVKRRKARQHAANQTILDAQHAPPPSQYNQAEYKPVPMQSPPLQPQTYFAPQDQKTYYQPTTQAHQHGLQSPVLSSPPTPAPPYVQAYRAAPNAPAEGAHEVDATTTAQMRPGQQPGVFEMGSGK